MSVQQVRIPAEVVSLEALVEARVIGATEVHLAAWVARASGVSDPLIALAVAMAAWAAQHGHACADLDELAEAVAKEHAVRADDPEVITVAWPSTDVWIDALRAATAVVRVAEASDAEPQFDTRPLVLHGHRVYLQRYWMDESAVAAAMCARAINLDTTLSPDAATVLEHLLPAHTDGEPNLQRAAADMVLRSRLALIVGGPGTGKTYSVARLLAVLLEQSNASGEHLRIALAAPTGKAAARLQESITAAMGQPDVKGHISESVRSALASIAPTTIHRLLGPLGAQRQRFRHHAGDPLPHDVLVIDETSMVSLPLLARLVEALSPTARLVLIGDPDQLESVELGSVLGDLVAASAVEGPLSGRSVRLLRGHRFGGNTPIALLADAIRRGDADGALAHLRSGTVTDGSSVHFLETDDPLAASVLAAVQQVVGPVLAEVRAAAEAGDAETALAAAARARILCAHRRGPYGVDTWNQLGERWMCDDRPQGTWFAGRPLLATRNDARLGVANGDTGVVVRHEGRLVAVFRTALGVQRFEPVQLEAVETAYATTVHKSQGSEYPTVVLVLPPATSPLAGRELVYTGATRARTTLHVVGNESAITTSLRVVAHRMSGLTDALRD